MKVKVLPIISALFLVIIMAIQSNSDERCVKEVAIEPNIPLGYEEQFKFVEQSMTLAQDEVLVLYTDGITEALNKNQEMLDMEGWKKIVERVKALPTASLPVESLLAEVKAFIGDAEQVDDITLLVISKINNICSRNKSEQ